jgi:hypothetical protein
MERAERVEGRAAATLAAALFTGTIALVLMGPTTFLRSVPVLVGIPMLAMALVLRFGRAAALMVGALLVASVIVAGGSGLLASVASLAGMGIVLGGGARRGFAPRVTCLVASLPVAAWLLVELYSGGRMVVVDSLRDQLGDVALKLGDLLARLFPALPASGYEALAAAFPALLLAWSVVLAAGVYRLGELALRHLGLRVPVTVSFSKVSLPWWVTWVAIAGLVLSLWGPSFLGATGVNMVIGSVIAYSFQGASVLSFWLRRATGSAVRTIIVLGVWSLGAHLLAVVGFVDTWWDLRRLRGSR